MIEIFSLGKATTPEQLASLFTEDGRYTSFSPVISLTSCYKIINLQLLKTPKPNSMKKLYSILLVSAFLFLNVNSGFCTVHIISGVGFTFSPDSISAVVGDTIVFNINANHDAVEVSQATWNINGTTSNGGFSVPFGGGATVVTQVKTYYYVCQNHASMGMKGRLFVTSPTGLPPVFVCEYTGFDMFPNPASSSVTIQANLATGKEHSLKIFNILGNCICQEANIPYNYKFNLAGIPDGVYILEVRSGEALVQKRLVVRR
jgi:plastocyanin